MTFNNDDLDKIFDPMEKKFANKQKDTTIDWEKKYNDLKEELNKLLN